MCIKRKDLAENLKIVFEKPDTVKARGNYFLLRFCRLRHKFSQRKRFDVSIFVFAILNEIGKVSRKAKYIWFLH